MARGDRSVEILKRIYRQKVSYFMDMAKLYQEKLDELERSTDGNRLEKSEASKQQERVGGGSEGRQDGSGMVRKA